MGVGKGTVARELAKDENYFAIDTDDLIESIQKRKIKKIFKEEGEEYFRKLEKRVAIWLKNSVDNTIISTGGGFYKIDFLNDIGMVIYLKSSFEAILQRILNHPNAKEKLAKRPLLKDIEKAKELFDLREPEYLAKADLVIDVENSTKEKIVEAIKGKIKSKK